MTFMCTFTVEVTPVAKGRPRFSNRGGFAKAYTPKKTADYEAHITNCAKRVMGGQSPVEYPVALSLQFFLPIPKAWNKTMTLAAKRGEIKHTKKPDVDNFAKAVMDAFNGVLYEDDSQVVDLHVSKAYSDLPRIEVTMIEVLEST